MCLRLFFHAFLIGHLLSSLGSAATRTANAVFHNPIHLSESNPSDTGTIGIGHFELTQDSDGNQQIRSLSVGGGGNHGHGMKLRTELGNGGGNHGHGMSLNPTQLSTGGGGNHGHGMSLSIFDFDGKDAINANILFHYLANLLSSGIVSSDSTRTYKLMIESAEKDIKSQKIPVYFYNYKAPSGGLKLDIESEQVIFSEVDQGTLETNFYDASAIFIMRDLSEIEESVLMKYSIEGYHLGGLTLALLVPKKFVAISSLRAF